VIGENEGFECFAEKEASAVLEHIKVLTVIDAEFIKQPLRMVLLQQVFILRQVLFHLV
jgi:hypothetical protein